MGLKKGDIIDEFKRYPDSCGLVVKVMHGGEGFQKIVCCGHELTEADVVPARLNKFGRKISPKGVGYIIDEKKSHPSACGLRLMVVDGGQGLQRMECCGHTLTLADEKELLTLGFGNLREPEPEEEPDQSPGPAGTA
jgi:hypothetical protein